MGDATHQGEDTEIHMRMNWQLWNYYHRCGYKPDFWQTLFKLLRENRIVESNPGEGQLKFAMMASKAANENLTEFFDLWGFFEPVNETIEQYGTWNYVVTEQMIQEAKAFMAQFPAPKHAFQYLNVKITKTISYSRSGQQISITDGDEAVAFEVRKDNKLLYFSNAFHFTVPSSISLEGAGIYAVQADGKRIECKAQ